MSIHYSAKLSPKWHENKENCAEAGVPESTNYCQQIEFIYLLKFISPNYKPRDRSNISSLGSGKARGHPPSLMH